MNKERASDREPVSGEELPVEGRVVEQRDAVVFRYGEVYRSPEWKKLDEIDRAQLLLVLEGVKPGTVIDGDYTNFKKVIEQTGLATHRNTDPYSLRPVYEVSTPKRLAEYYRDVVAAPTKLPRGEFHRINGRFLGYPPCCTEEYIRPEKNLEARNRVSPSRFLSNVDYEAKQMIDRGEGYPAELDYCPPSFTPCSATCENAIPLLRQWKRVLEAADPEAARGMCLFNWSGEPYRSVHREELSHVADERIARWRERFLRKSVGVEEGGDS